MRPPDLPDRASAQDLRPAWWGSCGPSGLARSRAARFARLLDRIPERPAVLAALDTVAEAALEP